jgi:hypothetical protein
MTEQYRDLPIENLDELWQDFRPGRHFNTAVPLRVHLHGKDVNYAELSLGDGRRFAVLYFDTERRMVYLRGNNGVEISLTAHPFYKPFVVGREALRFYEGFFGDTESCVSEEQCQISLVEAISSKTRGPYPVVEVKNLGRNRTFCRMFQNPNPQSPSNEQEQT